MIDYNILCITWTSGLVKGLLTLRKLILRRIKCILILNYSVNWNDMAKMKDGRWPIGMMSMRFDFFYIEINNSYMHLRFS